MEHIKLEMLIKLNVFVLDWISGKRYCITRVIPATEALLLLCRLILLDEIFLFEKEIIQLRLLLNDQGNVN